MKILLVNTTAHTGGASIACQRLKHALEGRGHEVRLLVRGDDSGASDTALTGGLVSRCVGRRVARWKFIWERLCLLRHIP